MVGIYLRTTQRRNKDGSLLRYVQLAHNRRADGVTQAEVLVPLGREDTLDRDGLVRLVASIHRYLGLPDTGAPAGVAELVGDRLSVAGSRPMGTAHLLVGLWRQLGVDSALRRVLGSRRFTTDVEGAVRAGREPGDRPDLQARPGGVGDLNRPGLSGGPDPTEGWAPASTEEVPAGGAGAGQSARVGGDGRRQTDRLMLPPMQRPTLGCQIGETVMLDRWAGPAGPGRACRCGERLGRSRRWRFSATRVGRLRR